MISITFKKASLKHKNTIFSWLAEPHMIEFWDNTQEHKDDIVNFMNGRKESSPYFGGVFTYWVGSIKEEPFCFILTGDVNADQEYPNLWRAHFSKTGKTVTIDFGIGNTKFLGKGLAALTLEQFILYYQNHIDPQVDTFFIDPDENNPPARRVYKKAGFKYVDAYCN